MVILTSTSEGVFIVFYGRIFHICLIAEKFADFEEYEMTV